PAPTQPKLIALVALMVSTAGTMTWYRRPLKRIAISRGTLKRIAVSRAEGDATPKDRVEGTHQIRADLREDVAAVLLRIGPGGAGEPSGAAGDRDHVRALGGTRVGHPLPDHGPEQLIAVGDDHRFGSRNPVVDHRTCPVRGEKIVGED